MLDTSQKIEQPKAAVNHLLKRLAVAVGRLILAAINLYALALLLYFVARLLMGEQWAVVGLINSLVPVVLLPALMLLVVFLILAYWLPRRRLQILLLLPSVAALAFLYGGMFLPRPARSLADAPQLALLTYNLHAQWQNLEPVEAVIRAAGADVVGLQELSAPAADWLVAKLADVYPYHATHTSPTNGIVGQGIFSRYPLESDEFWQNGGNPIGQRVQFTFEGVPVTYLNVHPPIPFSLQMGYLDTRREGEISDILARVEQVSGAVLLAGDFNMSDQSDDYARITAIYGDTFREAGWGFGFSYPDYYSYGGWSTKLIPFLRLDYVFHSAHWQGLEAQVWPDAGGSDHHPLFVRLALTGDEQ